MRVHDQLTFSRQARLELCWPRYELYNMPMTVGLLVTRARSLLERHNAAVLMSVESTNFVTNPSSTKYRIVHLSLLPRFCLRATST